jgi:hypothetical protein
MSHTRGELANRCEGVELAQAGAGIGNGLAKGAQVERLAGRLGLIWAHDGSAMVGRHRRR